MFKIQPSEFYGGAFDLPDARDFHAEHIFGVARPTAELAKKINLLRTTAHNQGNTNRCTAFALTHIHEILNTIEHNLQFQFDPEEQWQNQKKFPGTAREEIGDSLQSALESLRKFGLSREGQNYPIRHYAQIERGEIRNYLAKGFPIFTGFPTTATNFQKARTTGFWGGIDGAQIGGHAICFVGYDENGIVALNSWGAKWGKFGNGTFYFREADLASSYSLYIVYDKVDANSQNSNSNNPTQMQNIFKDVTTNSPMAEAIKWGLEKNIARGYGESSDATQREFRPNQPITRAETIQMLYNFGKEFGLL